ncbi:hypothetical protein HW555_010894 [Spodoptera exigua]|uniref:Uncharacterized protein n=1 Tax=Spodoptera exigua TaxID=7107 RepID=A0A835G6A0_SPOEX|nr:hypothetical protein HW555_010894 [Spodoptera exigua]
MKWMDKLPTVISCCFCCFLRAGTVLIGLFSFYYLMACYNTIQRYHKSSKGLDTIGILFAPNVSHSPGYWDMNAVLSNYSSMAELTAQMTIGVASIMLCSVSVLLLIGACCNMPVFIEIYQWGAIIYSATLSCTFLILALFCFFVHNNCFMAGGVLLVTGYFVIVTNSLRMSLLYLSSNDIVI